jgi:DNA repair exonuclease SbcCD nuclease subunit
MMEFGDKYRTKRAEGRGASLLFHSEEDIPQKKGVRVYGASFEGHFARETLLCDERGEIPALSPSYINILVLHGEADVSRSMYNPISKDVLRECGFDLCALGHVHSYKKTEDYIYSGVLCSRGFDELGDCGVVVGEITDEGRVLTEFIPINVRKYVAEEIDVSEETDFSVDALSDLILSKTDKEFCTKVILKGIVPLQEKIDVEGLQMRLTGKYPQVKVVDNTSVEADWRLISEENSLRGIFVRRMLEKLRDTEDGKYSTKNIQDAMKIGIKAFGGKL